MDMITQFFSNLDNNWLTAASMLLDNFVIFLSVIVIATLLGEQRQKKVIKIGCAIFLAVVIAGCLKLVIIEPRPCAGLNLPYCQDNSSFPSLHAVAAFVLMISFLNKLSFPYYLVLSLLVAFSRLVIAAHYFRDIAAALPIAIVSYYIIDVLWTKGHKGHRWKNKNGNQCDRRDPTASTRPGGLARFAGWGMPHSVTTFQIRSLQAAGYSTQFENKLDCGRKIEKGGN